MFERKQVSVVVSRLAEPPQKIIVITGPRQTGKSTIVRQALRHARSENEQKYIALDEPAAQNPSPYTAANNPAILPAHTKPDARYLVAEWEKARTTAKNSDQPYVLVLDEIQKIPQWSDVIKGLWDADRTDGIHLHVILLGSAPLLMQKGLTESLAGRYELIRVSHWSFPEMQEAFDMDLASFIYFGGYPGSMSFISEPARWRAYIRDALIEPNIHRDILMMTRVDKPALLRRLFDLGCHHSGQILSYTKMIGQLQDAGNTTTLAHYLELLTYAGLVAGFQKYARQQHRRRASSPKLNVLNTALMSVTTGYSFEQAQADRTHWGRLAESAVGAHLFNAGMPEVTINYWRESPYEVDFVLERGGQIIAIEVKTSSKPQGRQGMAAFSERFRPEKAVLVGGEGIPLEEFLKSTRADWFDTAWPR